jgi:uncharacterized protein (DUF1697 family)
MSGGGLDVALLRGVNVGGVTVTSAPLAAVFRDLGFGEVRTVLASGNVVFDGGGAPPSVLKGTIEKALADAFGYDAWIVLTDQARVRAVVESFPFAEAPDRQPYVLFASDEGVLAELAELAVSDTAAGIERVTPGDGVLYWDLPRGSSTDTAFAKRTARARYRSTTTTRNLRTLRKLL